MSLIKISDFADVITGGTPSTSVNEYWDGGTIPWLQSGCCQNCIISGCDTFITEEGLSHSAAKLMKPESVLIALTGATTGKVGFLTFEACANQSVTGIQPNGNFIPKYLFYYLLSKREKILSDSYGGAQKHISQGYVKDILFPMIPMEQQKNIVKTLEKADKVVRTRKQQLSALDTLIKARFVEMFGSYPTNEKNWETGIVRDIISEVRYGSSRPAVDGGKYPYLRMNNITYGGELDLSDTKQIDIPEKELPKCTVRRGDVLFNRTNSKELVGKTCVYDRDELMVLAGFVIRVRLNDLVIPEFLSAFLNTDFSKQMLLGMCKAAIGQANINAQEMQNIGLYIPPIAIQKEFVSFKAQVDKSKAVIQKALDEAQVLFDSLMQKYFG